MDVSQLSGIAIIQAFFLFLVRNIPVNKKAGNTKQNKNLGGNEKSVRKPEAPIAN